MHKRFEKEREYVNKTYAQAANEVYHTKEYMHYLFLPWILLSHFLWPHHFRQRLFFEACFLPETKAANLGRFFDVGIGTGYYSRLLLEALPGARGSGFDISEHSRAYTQWQLGRFGVSDRYDITLVDITTLQPPPACDWLVSVEVLEHLEDPVSFLKGLRAMLTSTGKAFITAAINASNEDHIYLYRDVGEVMAQLRVAGFHVEQFHSSFGYKPKQPDLPVPEIAAFVAVPA